MVTIKQLQREIAKEERSLVQVEKKQGLITEKDRLKRKLFLLRNRKVIASAGKVSRFIKRQVKIAAPIVKKQIKLIRDQQLRDDAIARKQAPIKKKVKKKKFKKQPSNNQEFSAFGDLGF